MKKNLEVINILNRFVNEDAWKELNDVVFEPISGETTLKLLIKYAEEIDSLYDEPKEIKWPDPVQPPICPCPQPFYPVYPQYPTTKPSPFFPWQPDVFFTSKTEGTTAKNCCKPEDLTSK